MKRPSPGHGASGFTLIELLIVIALVAIVLGLAAPSFTDYIAMQRLRGTNAQLVTDIQFARSEAVSRNERMYMRFQGNADMTCYVIFTSPNGTSCDCTAAEGARCTDPTTTEVRTVQVPLTRAVRISAAGNSADAFSFDPRTGGMYIVPSDSRTALPTEYVVDTFIDGARKLRDIVGLAGRLKVCTPTGSQMQELACN